MQEADIMLCFQAGAAFLLVVAVAVEIAHRKSK